MQVHRFQPDRSDRSAPGKYGGAKKKARPTFDELLEKYRRIGATQKQKTQPEKIKPSLKHQEQILPYFKVIVALRCIHLLDRLYHGPGHILATIYLGITVV